MFRYTGVFCGSLHLAVVLFLVAASNSALAATYANTATTFSWVDATSHTQVGYNTAPYKFNGTLGSSACGTAPPTLDDTISDAIPIGFNFFFGDRSFDKLRILANGRVQFIGTAPAYDNTTCGFGSPVTQIPLPDAGLNYTLRIFGNDLDPSLQSEVAGYTTSCTSRTGANACFVSYGSSGITPNRRFVITWNNVPEWAAASKTTGNYNIQIILQEDGDFIYQYGADTPGPGATTGEVGWQVSTTDYDKPSVGYPAANTAIRYFTPHPVVEYRMEETTWSGAGTVLDSSGFGRDGSPVGAAQSTGSGKICRGASIPAAGVNVIDTGTPVATIGNAGMIAFWYKATTAWSGAGTQDAQLFDATTVNNQWFFLTRRGGTGANAGKLRFVVTDSTNTARVVETPAIAVAANTWKHIAVTWTFNNLVGGNNDRLRIYVDGVQQAQTTFTSTTATLSPQIDTLYLGGSRAGMVGSNGTANSTDGTLDEFSAYNYEAPAAKIVQVRDQINSVCLAHYAISHDGTAPACLPPRYTVTAHNVGHAPVPVNTVINLSTSDGTGIWSLLTGRGALTPGAVNSGTASYQFINESQAVFALTHPAAGSVTAHVTDGNFGEQENSAQTITSCSTGKFNACEVSSPKCTPTAASNAYAYLFTKLVNTGFNLDLVALSGGVLDATFAKPVTVSLLANTNTPVLSAATNCPTTQTATIALGSATFAAGRASLAVPAIASAYRDVRVRFVCNSTNCPPSGVTACAPDAFAVRPPNLVVSSTANADNTGANTSATPKIAAGSAFTLTADSATTGYNGIPNFDGTKAEWAAPPTGGRPGGVGTAFGYFTTAATLASGNGASGNNFSYDEAGYFRLLAAGIYDPSYAAYSGDVGNGDCIANSYSNSAVGGKIGCLIANTSPTNHFGRFIPDHFDEVLTHGCAGGAFTYSAQPFTLQLTARNAAGTTTQNYSQTFAKAVTLSDANAVAGGTMSSTAVASAAFTTGVATAKPAFAFTRTTPDKAPATIKLHAVDTDGVLSVSAAEKTTPIRIGRLMLVNAYGSEKASLPIPVQAQYWTGKSWLLNGADSCTTIPATSVALSNYLDGKGAAGAWTTTAAGTTLAGGLGNIVLTAPNPAGSTGTVDVAVNLGIGISDQSCLATHPAMVAPANSLAWLRGKNGPCAASNTHSADPSARASFGVFPAEQRKAVHIRELY
jgi:MSHA biogenesis protein MshQ